MTQDFSGLVIIDKSGGITSGQVVSRLRRILGIRKIGHAGTLDPMATGVLVAGVNRATRLMTHLIAHDKRYLATIRLGESRSTDDADGEVTGGGDTSAITDSSIESAIAGFRGVISQVPASVSAIKVGGRRAYDVVRGGDEVTLPAREVTITRYDLCAIRRTHRFIDLDVDVECSSGTYIRSLARDLGAVLGCGGHLTSLRRTRVGVFSLDDAVTLPEGFASASGRSAQDAGSIDLAAARRHIMSAAMTMAEAARRTMDVVDISDDQAHAVSVGRPLTLTLDHEPTGLLHRDRLLGLYRPGSRDPNLAEPIAVLCTPADVSG